MTELLTSAQMRAIETAAIASGDVTGLELMERAGRGVVAAILKEWPELATAPHRAVVLCGPGNNGGDGFVVARLLKECGWEVALFLYGDANKLPTDARVNYERWLPLGDVAILTMPQPDGAELKALDRATRVSGTDTGPALIVDAMFGTGLIRPISSLAQMLDTVQIDEPTSDPRSPYVVAIDIPSGVCTDSGKALGGGAGTAVGAHLTVAFHRAKHGHHLGMGPARAGRLRVADIGLATRETQRARARKALCELHGTDPIHPVQLRAHRLLEIDRFGALAPDLWKQSGHKYAHGHALILSGGAGHGGAARMAARGALRIGAGLVTVGCPPEALAENAAQLTAIMLREVADAGVFRELLSDERLNALCLGPGLGNGAAQHALILAALETKRACVLDADALSILFFDEADALFGQLHDKVVLTPHAGEFARLFSDIAEKLNAPATKGPAYSKVDATRAAAKRAGCTVLFKGPDTVIAAPDGRCAINSAQYERAAPWLATAGAGDVLAGFITGLLARGFEPMQAAETAAWLHVECALKFGPGLIAEDLPEQLPAVFRDLGL